MSERGNLLLPADERHIHKGASFSSTCSTQPRASRVGSIMKAPSILSVASRSSIPRGSPSVTCLSGVPTSRQLRASFVEPQFSKPVLLAAIAKIQSIVNTLDTEEGDAGVPLSLLQRLEGVMLESIDTDPEDTVRKEDFITKAFIDTELNVAVQEEVPDTEQFAVDRVRPALQRDGKDVMAALHRGMLTTTRAMEAQVRFIRVLKDRGVLSEEDYSEGVALRGMKAVEEMWSHFDWMAGELQELQEKMSISLHQLRTAQEQTRTVAVENMKHRKENAALRMALRWWRGIGRNLLHRNPREVEPGNTSPSPSLVPSPPMTGTVVSFDSHRCVSRQSFLVVALDEAKALQQHCREGWDGVLEMFRDCIIACAKEFDGARLVAEGSTSPSRGNFLLSFPDLRKAAEFAHGVQVVLMSLPWPPCAVGEDHPVCPTVLRGEEGAEQAGNLQAQYHATFSPPSGTEEAYLRKFDPVARQIADKAEVVLPNLPDGLLFRGPRARMGIHNSALPAQDDGVPSGKTACAMKASLLCAAARGGEVLISTAAADDLSDWIARKSGFTTPVAIADLSTVVNDWRTPPLPTTTTPPGPAALTTLFAEGETAVALLPHSLVLRHPLLPDPPDPRDHLCRKYNPSWWLRYSNQPPLLPPEGYQKERKDSEVDSPSPPQFIMHVRPRVPVDDLCARYEQAIMEMAETLSHTGATTPTGVVPQGGEVSALHTPVEAVGHEGECEGAEDQTAKDGRGDPPHTADAPPNDIGGVSKTRSGKEGEKHPLTQEKLLHAFESVLSRLAVASQSGGTCDDALVGLGSLLGFDGTSEEAVSEYIDRQPQSSRSMLYSLKRLCAFATTIARGDHLRQQVLHSQQGSVGIATPLQHSFLRRSSMASSAPDEEWKPFGRQRSGGLHGQRRPSASFGRRMSVSSQDLATFSLQGSSVSLRPTPPPRGPLTPQTADLEPLYMSDRAQ